MRTVLRTSRGRFRIRFCWTALEIERIVLRRRALLRWLHEMMEAGFE